MPDWSITRLRGELCLTWYEGDIRRRYRLGTDDPKEASRRAPARYAELTRPKGSTVQDLWTAYCLDKEGRSVVTTMGFTWKALAPFFADKQGEAVTIAECRAYTAARRKAGKKDGSIHTELGHLRSVLVWAQKQRLITHAPHIERPAKPDPKEGYLTRPEVSALMEAANAPHVKLAIQLMLGTGARSAAALQLTWDRVDFARRMIQLRNPFDKAHRKGRATVPINDSLFTALQEAHKGSLTPYVIEWAGGSVKSIKKGIGTAGGKIGRDDVSPHMLRHSAAVWLAEDGHSMEEIAQFLGHSNTAMTYRVYARYSPNYLRRLSASLEV
ncbi:site-specific integrase [Mesorhizobium sp. M4B.F.Ca.ET.143.01.1.1]|uniref:tyrosine-type recombinase/integrase n=1 Tax=Mesorhizobium sp. M4B.F.Ca.ET.143.01.1.1 TaxID=2563947 RepID=UPI001093A56B|nr:site-specific integrase [Mesorhizobium sp. M4B.F.Ca.ET.143.01.1.1]TGV26377.1 site-specific integrase [Mesorhizobium sp. M4B.F.Ca.ET.143.01.1.1]